MEGPFFQAELRLISPDLGGRRQPLFHDDRLDWDLGNTWLGKPTLDGGRVLLDERAQIEPGGTAIVRIQPLVPERWGEVRPGLEIPMHEGPRVIGHARILEILARPAYWTPEVARFVNQARQFCDFVEKPPGTLLERIERTRHGLLELYTRALALPDVEPPEDLEDEPSIEPPASWIGFEQFEIYWEVDDPQGETPVARSLSDDVLDVYCDLRRGLALWDQGSADHRISAILEWRFHFDHHWGDHAIGAVRALHRARTI